MDALTSPAMLRAAAPDVDIKTWTDQSIIVPLHARWTSVWAEHEKIDESSNRVGADALSEQAFHERAMKENSAEADHLQLALLYQVPTTWQEATILMSHIYLVRDGGVEPHSTLHGALDVAIVTMFDFMCCEVAQDHDKLGADFKQCSMHAWRRRRYRTGEMEA